MSFLFFLFFFLEDGVGRKRGKGGEGERVLGCKIMGFI